MRAEHALEILHTRIEREREEARKAVQQDAENVRSIRTSSEPNEIALATARESQRMHEGWVHGHTMALIAIETLRGEI